jgi:minor histocompatibility antigen H13
MTLHTSPDRIFLALALRFDYALARARSPAPLRPRANFAKPYFMACFFAYILGQEPPFFALVQVHLANFPSAFAGLCVTMAMMHYFRAAQPALLYLSPACILAVALTALARGELNAFWRYVEEEEEPSSQEKGREKEGEESQDQSSPKESLVDVEATGRSSSHDSPAECRVDDPGSARDLPEVTPRLRQRANASK